TDMLRQDRSPEAEGRLENLKELTNALQEFDTLPAFLEHVALLTDNAERAGSDMVSVMTLHAAKGLEFDTVFLPGWEEGRFTNQRAIDAKPCAPPTPPPSTAACASRRAASTMRAWA